MGWVKPTKKDLLMFARILEMVPRTEMVEIFKKSKKENITVLPISQKIMPCIKLVSIQMISVIFVVIMNLENFMTDRENCYSSSCDADTPIEIEDKKDASGRWIWQNQERNQ